MSVKIREISPQLCESLRNEQKVKVETCKQYVRIQGISKIPIRPQISPFSEHGMGQKYEKYDGMYSKVAQVENGRLTLTLTLTQVENGSLTLTLTLIGPSREWKAN